jgi:hypothetical protein
MWLSNYVATLSADVLSAKSLEWLGHILDLATLRVICCQPHMMREIRQSGSAEGVVSHRDPYSDYRGAMVQRHLDV